MKKILLLYLMSLIFFIQFCETPSEPDPAIISTKGDAIIVNPSILREEGVKEIFINEGDTIPLFLRTIIGNRGSYTFTSENNNVVSVNDDSLWIIAKGDSGQSTSITINDIVNDILKDVTVNITNKWADPLYYDYLGSFEGHNYYLSTIKDLWTIGNKYCDRELSNGHLYVANSYEEHVAITKMVDHEPAWIGLQHAGVNKDKNRNDWLWINGDSLIHSLNIKRLKNVFDFGEASYENLPYFFLSKNNEYDRADDQEQKKWIMELE